VGGPSPPRVRGSEKNGCGKGRTQLLRVGDNEASCSAFKKRKPTKRILRFTRGTLGHSVRNPRAESSDAKVPLSRKGGKRLRIGSLADSKNI